jgi:hypothetical protein
MDTIILRDDPLTISLPRWLDPARDPISLLSHLLVPKMKHAVAIADDGQDGEVRYLGEIDNSPASGSWWQN